MNSDDSAPRILGFAFLLQAITSLVNGVILRAVLIAPGNISETMIRIANHPWLMRTNVLGGDDHRSGSHLPRSSRRVGLGLYNSISAVEATVLEFGMFVVGAAVYAWFIIKRRRESSIAVSEAPEVKRLVH